MKKKSLHINYQIFHSPSDLSTQFADLIKASHDAMQRAYAPYSEFFVGAALLLDDGTIVEGSNQENAAYPSGLCAERVALFYAGSRFPDKKVKAIAIVAKNIQAVHTKDIVSPCGSCRQVMVETEYRQHEPMTIILSSLNGDGVIFDSVSQLMPFSFDISSFLSE